MPRERQPRRSGVVHGNEQRPAHGARVFEFPKNLPEGATGKRGAENVQQDLRGEGEGPVGVRAHSHAAVGRSALLALSHVHAARCHEDAHVRDVGTPGAIRDAQRVELLQADKKEVEGMQTFWRNASCL